MKFVGDMPFVLVILSPEPTAIDLDEPGWATKYAHLMRQPGRWILARKADSTPLFDMVVHEGEQPYFTSRVLGAFLPPPDVVGVSQEEALEIADRAEVRAYGIGKKRLDGHVDRLWVLPTGVICAGDDVNALGEALAHAQLFDMLHKESTNGRREAQGNSRQNGSRQGIQDPRPRRGSRREQRART